MPSLKPISKEAKNKKTTSSKMGAQKNSQHKLSTEYIQDSDSGDEENSDTNSTNDDDSLPENLAATVPKGKGQTKRPVSESSSSSGSEDESEDESTGESSSEGSEDEQVPSKKNKKTRSGGSDHTRTTTKLSNTKEVSLEKPAYTPPSGFDLTTIDGAQRTSQLLNGSNLEGKEVWYIMAPASVPLSSIKELSLLNIQERKEILSYNGDDYAFVPDASEAKEYTKVMVPHASGDGYRTGKTPISRILHLQQTIPRAKFSSQATVPAKNPVRQQPPGLKIRFRPIGFDTKRTGSSSSSDSESSTESSSDQEMPDAPAAKFRKAGSLSTSSDDSSDDDIDSNTKITEAKLPSKSGAKPKVPVVGSNEEAGRSMKRKHSEEENKKSKHSSFSSANITDDRKLKRVKIQVENPGRKSKDYRQSISIN